MAMSPESPGSAQIGQHESDPRVERLYRYLLASSAAERATLLCKLAGWFRPDPAAEFWDAVDCLTLGERD